MTTELKASDAAAIANAVVETPGVARLSPGGAVEVATYLPGNRVRGVHVQGAEVEVHIVALPTAQSLPHLAASIRRNVMTRFPGVDHVGVTIDDLDSIGLPDPTSEPIDAHENPPDRDLTLHEEAAIDPVPVRVPVF